MTQQSFGISMSVNNKLSKKTSKKSTQNQIPIDSLGFRAKIFYDSNYQYVPRKKPNRYTKYQSQKRQSNFRSKLTCVVDPSHATHQQIGDLKFNKRSEWKKIKYVLFKTKQQIFCCICLNKEFIAPQMTFCGHVFCWHCIMMHYEKSLKATSCPVCNQIFQLDQLKICVALYLPPLNAGDKVRLSLKFRLNGLRTIFNPQTLQQQTNLSYVIRMKNRKILLQYQQQNQQIIKQMKTVDDPDTQKYLLKVLQKSQQKIQLIKQQINQQSKCSHIKPHKHQILKDDIITHILTPQDLIKQYPLTFYQQQSGRYVYLHPICQKYLLKNYQSSNLPLIIQQCIILKQQTQFSQSNIKKYKYLNHLSQNQNFDFIFIKMNNLIDYKLMEQFDKQFDGYKKKKKEFIEKQQFEAKMLNQKYQKEQNYLRELKKMEMSQFHDIKVPTNMIDLNQIHDQNIFPSLVQNKQQSNNSNKQQQRQQFKESSVQFNYNSKKKPKKKNFILKQQDFPGLQLAIKNSLTITQQPSLQLQQKNHQLPQINRTKSQQLSQSINKIKQDQFPTFDKRTISLQQQINDKLIYVKNKKDLDEDNSPNTKVKGKKKKKQKFVDVTSQFFQRKNSDEQ